MLYWYAGGRERGGLYLGHLLAVVSDLSHESDNVCVWGVSCVLVSFFECSIDFTVFFLAKGGGGHETNRNLLAKIYQKAWMPA